MNALVFQNHQKEIEELNFLDMSVSFGMPAVLFSGAWSDKDTLTDEMKKSGIREAAVYHLTGKTYDANYGNSRLMEQIADTPQLIPTWVAVPSEEAMECSPTAFTDRIAAQGVKAVRMFPSSQSQPAVATRYAFSRWFYGDFMEVLEKRGIPVVIEFTPHRRSEPEWDNFYRLACEFPKLSIIMGDGYQRATWSLIKLMKTCPNLYALTTGLDVHRQLEYMVQQVGAMRFLAASKFPVATFGTMVGQVLFSFLSPEQKKLVAGDNARRLMGIAIRKGGDN